MYCTSRNTDSVDTSVNFVGTPPILFTWSGLLGTLLFGVFLILDFLDTLKIFLQALGILASIIGGFPIMTGLGNI